MEDKRLESSENDIEDNYIKGPNKIIARYRPNRDGINISILSNPGERPGNRDFN